MIRLREDIAAQLRQNTRPVLVDCLGGARVVAEDRATWEFLRALDGAHGPPVPEIERFLDGEELLARAGAVGAERRRRRLAELAALVEFAREHVPFYRRAYAQAPREIADGAQLTTLPALTKDDLRAEFPAGLLADGFDYATLIRSGQAEVLYSSGSTLDGDRAPSLHLVDEDESNHDSPFGIHAAGERQARFSTPRCTGRECYIHQQSREDRTFGPNLILNSSADPMFMSDAALHEVARELADWEPLVLSGNPWYLAVLVRFLERERIELPESIVAVVLGTELAPDPVRRYLTERTGVIPFDNYSASEIGNVATTCPLGVHHVFESVHVEVIRDGRPAAPGELGEVVVSNLGRRAMPIIRYRTGDLAAALPGCRCGLPHPALELHGRIAECLVSGAAFVTPRELDRAVAAVDGLLFYRAHQAADEGVTLELVARPDCNRAASDVGAELAGAVGALGLRVAGVKAVERMHARDSMKFSTVISKVRDRHERVDEGLRDARP